MDFSIPAPAGVPVAAVIVLRGADPMVTFPPGHVYLQLRPGAPYVVPPGAVAGQALPFSLVQGTLGALIRAMAANAGVVVLLQPAAPLFLNGALTQAIADGFPVKAYGSDTELCAACARRHRPWQQRQGEQRSVALRFDEFLQ